MRFRSKQVEVKGAARPPTVPPGDSPSRRAAGNGGRGRLLEPARSGLQSGIQFIFSFLRPCQFSSELGRLTYCRMGTKMPAPRTASQSSPGVGINPRASLPPPPASHLCSNPKLGRGWGTLRCRWLAPQLAGTVPQLLPSQIPKSALRPRKGAGPASPRQATWRPSPHANTGQTDATSCHLPPRRVGGWVASP